jgi:methyltransferase (TIGR00027 family)
LNENDQKVVSASGPIAATVFYILNILLFPITLLGYVIWIGKAYLTGRKSGVSMTAQGPLSARWAQHNLGVREDEPANRLMMVLPNISPLAVRLVSGPLLLAHRLTGCVPRAFRYPFEGDIPVQYEASARQTFFDTVVDRYLADIAQFAILGAGFDTRAFRLPKDARVRSFEVDAPQTEVLKREMLEKAGIASTGVTFVAADFEQEDWLRRLVEAGFDPDKPALFLWEGVIMYLDREAVEDTLRKIAGTATGSVVAFDYFTTESLKSKSLYWRYGRAMTKAAGEPVTFGIDSPPPSSERLAELLRSCGLSLGKQRTLGQETGGKRAWGGFATAIVSKQGNQHHEEPHHSNIKNISYRVCI